MPEVALNVPFEASEIVHIAAEELQARMRSLGPLQGGKEYVAFSIDYQVKIRLRRAGESAIDERETLAWGKLEKGVLIAPDCIDAAGEGNLIPNTEATEVASAYQSKDPNEERVNRDMALTVETGDGRGGKIRKKVKVKG